MKHRTAPTSLLLSAAILAGSTLAEVPNGPPTFGDSLSFTNEYFVFVEGGIKALGGVDAEGTEALVIEAYRSEVRSFDWNGQSIATHRIDEVEFEDGELVEISRNYFGQASDGTIYYFGETVDNYEDGEIVDNDGSWLVGGATLPSDPPTTTSADAPAVFMPANPELGDTWKPEDTPPFVDENAEVVQVGMTVAVPYGTLDNALGVRETSPLSAGIGQKVYAPGLGLVLDGTRGEDRVELLISTF